MSRASSSLWLALAAASLLAASCSSSSSPPTYQLDRAAGATGTPCTDHITCGGGWCTDVGDRSVCTTTCSTQADCVAGWVCQPETNQSLQVCRCSASQEVCDLKDNDCNGLVDEGPYPDQTCAAQNGPGFVCKDGRCQCSLMCGSQCTDPNTDARNCGGCGKACPPNALCEKGACTCAGGKGICGGACMDLSADRDNCGKCGNQCPIGAVCSGGACTCPLGQAACTPSCADLSSDPVNCGTCGNACPSPIMSCLNSRCVGTLLDDTIVRSIALSNNYVYWLGFHMLGRVKKAGGPIEIVFIDQPNNGNDGYDCLAVDANNAYYTNFYGGVTKVPLSGGTPTLLAPTGNQPYTRSIGIDSATVYWAVNDNPGAIYSVPIGGGATTTLASGVVYPEGMVVGGGYVYYTEQVFGPQYYIGHAIKRVPTGGGPITQVTAGVNYGWALALDANNIYATTYEFPQTLVDIVKIPLSGGGPVTLVTGLPPHVAQIAVNATELYWTDSPPAFVGKVPIAGGAWDYVASAQFAAYPIAADATQVYWGTYETNGVGTISFGK